MVDQLLVSIKGKDHFEYKFYKAMLQADTMPRYADEIIDKLSELTWELTSFCWSGTIKGNKPNIGLFLRVLHQGSGRVIL